MATSNLSKARQTRDNLSSFFAHFLNLSLAISSQFTFEMFTATENRKKNTKTLYFGGSSSFKVISVNTAKKLVISVCYDKQHVYAYQQLFSCKTRLYR